MNALKRMMSFVTGSRPSEHEEVLPRCVQRMYIQEKDAGHRGPVVGSFLLQVQNKIDVVVSVTPSGLIVVSSEFGGVLSTVRPALGDAFTCAVMVPIARPGDTTPVMSGLVVGTQNGSILLIEISIETEQRIVAHCVTNSGISSLSGGSSLILAGTVDGKIIVWDPVLHPITPSVSMHAIPGCASAVSAILTFPDGTLWASVDEVGIQVLHLDPTPGSVACLARSPHPVIAFYGMHVITNMVEAVQHDLVICLSSCSEVYLIDKSTRELGQQYPASLMTCGVAMSSLAIQADLLFLGGVDGSLCVRELSKRDKDGKLQCVLLKCFHTLRPGEDAGCPITSLSCPDTETCVVGDASCCVFLVKFNKPEDTVSEARIERQNTGTPTLREERGSVDSFDLVSENRESVDLEMDPVERQVTSFRRISQPEIDSVDEINGVGESVDQNAPQVQQEDTQNDEADKDVLKVDDESNADEPVVAGKIDSGVVSNADAAIKEAVEAEKVDTQVVSNADAAIKEAVVAGKDNTQIVSTAGAAVVKEPVVAGDDIDDNKVDLEVVSVTDVKEAEQSKEDKLD